MKRFLSTIPLWQEPGLFLIRLVTGFFMIWHGLEVFDATKMQGYMDWQMFKSSSSGKFLVYLGKGSELVGGVLLFIGLFTRIAALILIVTMAYISFFVGHGKVWYEDQHPFLFVLLGLVFFFMGGGRWSLDHKLFKRKFY